jgi:hypothetical protein
MARPTFVPPDIPRLGGGAELSEADATDTVVVLADPALDVGGDGTMVSCTMRNVVVAPPFAFSDGVPSLSARMVKRTVRCNGDIVGDCSEKKTSRSSKRNAFSDGQKRAATMQQISERIGRGFHVDCTSSLNKQLLADVKPHVGASLRKY